MTTHLTISDLGELRTTAPLAVALSHLLAGLEQATDRVTARHACDNHHDRKADNTLRRQHADLTLVASYLPEVARCPVNCSGTPRPGAG